MQRLLAGGACAKIRTAGGLARCGRHAPPPNRLSFMMRKCRLLPIRLRPQASARAAGVARDRRRTGRAGSARAAAARVALVALLPLAPLTGCGGGSATGPAPGATPG